MQTTEILFAVLRYVVCGEALTEEIKKACTPGMLEAVYALAQKHDLAHLVAHAVEGLDIPDCEVLKNLKNAKIRAIYRYARMDYEYARICQILEAARIPFIPLKGSVLRQYYPEPWMRTSGDIDVLVKEDDLAHAVRELEAQGWTADSQLQYQNICLHASSGVLLELHFNIRVKMDAADAVMDAVWQNVICEEGKQYTYRQTDPFFICHHVAHMAKHVLVGGCGIRPFLDIWLLISRLPPDDKILQALCQEAHLGVFFQQALLLANVWFGKEQHTQMSEKLETFVLNGGVYGSVSNKVVVSQAIVGGKRRHFLHRMFVPYEEMKRMYPVLKEKGWLMPAYQVVRWIQALFDGRLQKAVSEMKANQSTTEEQRRQTDLLLRAIGLR